MKPTEVAEKYFYDKAVIPRSKWCVDNLVFDEPENQGPFRTAGREYIIDILDSFGDPSTTDHVVCFGTQLGKTAGFMGGLASTIALESRRIMWTMPTITNAQKFSRTRFMPMLRASNGTRHLIPTGADRHDFKTLEMVLGKSIIDMTGSNSPSNIASTPCGIVVQDEVEKFDARETGEASAVQLADMRTKNVSGAKRYKSSSPAMPEGLIWLELLKTDFRRWLVPCPHCFKRIVLIFSKQYTLIPLMGCEAEMCWDKEAKQKDGTWDLDRVSASAHFKCPHCAGKILDRHKTVMNGGGKWVATRTAARGFIGWHLPSFYSTAPECANGVIARRFLQQHDTIVGCQGSINSDFAEPYAAQDTVGKRVEIVRDRIETDKSKQMLVFDCQEKTPAFWYARTEWSENEIQIVEAGSFETWEEGRMIQNAHGIPDVCVSPDSGFGAKSDSEVYRNCAEYGEVIRKDTFDKSAGAQFMHIGWMPSKGMPGRKTWFNKEKKTDEAFTVRHMDPFTGTPKAGLVEMGLFEFSSDYFQDILDNMRRGKGGFKFSVAQSVNLGKVILNEKGDPVYPIESHITPALPEVFWRHMDAHVKAPQVDSFTGHTIRKWIKRSKSGGWPDHILDCVIISVAMAAFFGWLIIPEIKREDKK